MAKSFREFYAEYNPEVMPGEWGAPPDSLWMAVERLANTFAAYVDHIEDTKNILPAIGESYSDPSLNFEPFKWERIEPLGFSLDGIRITVPAADFNKGCDAVNAVDRWREENETLIKSQTALVHIIVELRAEIARLEKERAK